MIWIITFGILLATSITIFAVAIKLDKDGLDVAGLALSILFGILFFAFVATAICTSVHTQHQFEKDMMRYEIIQEQVDSGKYESVTLTEEIVKYNQEVFNAKHYHDSIFTGIFYYKGKENLPYVEVR